MPRRHSVRALRLASIWGGLALIVACGAGTDLAPSDDESSARLGALERRLTRANAYGEGPDGEAIAEALARRFPEDAIAVHVTAGSPRVIVALVSFEDLSSIPNEERETCLTDFLSTLDLRFNARNARVGLGLRGLVFYGAVGIREPGELELTREVGPIVSRLGLNNLMGVEAGELATEPAISVGAPMTATIDEANFFGNQRWVLDVTEPTRVVLHATRTDGNTAATANAVWSGICVGNTFNSDCESLRHEDTYEANLSPGVHTVFVGVVPNCDTASEPTCWRQTTPFRVELQPAE